MLLRVERMLTVREVKDEIRRLESAEEEIDKRTGKPRRVAPTQIKTTHKEKAQMLRRMLEDGHTSISAWFRELAGLPPDRKTR
jgi:hypothetical protein